MLEQYRGYWVGGTAKLIHPNNPETYPEATIYKPDRGGSIVLMGNFELPKFRVDSKQLAEVFGLELAKMVVDECLSRTLIKSDTPL